mgnify:CR=1 FL=1
MIVDFKSPFTATHSSGVAHCSVLLAKMSGMSEAELHLMESAGLLHDLGKLVIPNRFRICRHKTTPILYVFDPQLNQRDADCFRMGRFSP